MLMAAPALSAHDEDPLPDPDGLSANMRKPVQVYILLGQSNMLGFGKVKGGDGSLEYAIKEKGLYPSLVDDEGTGPCDRMSATCASWAAARGA